MLDDFGSVGYWRVSWEQGIMGNIGPWRTLSICQELDWVIRTTLGKREAESCVLMWLQWQLGGSQRSMFGRRIDMVMLPEREGEFELGHEQGG